MARSDHAAAGSLQRFFYEVTEGARRQGNVVFALIFRELKTRSGSEGHGLFSLVGILLEPAIGTLIMTGFYYLLRRQEVQGVHIILFLTISMTTFSVVRRSIATIPRTIRSNRAFYAFPNVKPFDAVLARFILETVLTILGGAILLFLIWWFLDLSIDMDWLLHGFGIFTILLVWSFGISLFIGVYGTRFPMLFKSIQLTSRGLMFLSAVIHPVSELPVEAQYYIGWNPIAHGMELMRQYLLGMTPFQDISLNYLIAWAAATLFLGFLSYYVNRLKVIER
jgi:capsular polysaccharide transport system permease protein